MHHEISYDSLYPSFLTGFYKKSITRIGKTTGRGKLKAGSFVRISDYSCPIFDNFR